MPDDHQAFKPLACEALDIAMMVDLMKSRNNYMTADHRQGFAALGKAWLEVQIGGATEDEANVTMLRKLSTPSTNHPHVTSDILVLKDNAIAKANDLWEIRKAGLPVTTWVPWSVAKARSRGRGGRIPPCRRRTLGRIRAQTESADA